ncbi:MAG: hypothetical protein AB7H93_25160 [Vicinamibacterales bacterium]
MTPELSPDYVRGEIVAYVLANHPSDHTAATLPLNESLLELGILDSYGVVELVVFLENTWGIAIGEDEITKERMGSIDKMTRLVLDKRRAAA